jgi:hypothetical protein
MTESMVSMLLVILLALTALSLVLVRLRTVRPATLTYYPCRIICGALFAVASVSCGVVACWIEWSSNGEAANPRWVLLITFAAGILALSSVATDRYAYLDIYYVMLDSSNSVQFETLATRANRIRLSLVILVILFSMLCLFIVSI